MPEIEIDGRRIQAKDGEMVIQAADAAGIYIPRFCYHEKLSIAANCRMCLVEVEKAPKPMPACATPVAEGMVVRTASTIAVTAQKATMEFLLINHPLDCPICDQGGECPLQDQAMGYGKDVSRFTLGKRTVDDQDIGPLITTEMTRCIHCTRCVRFGQEIAGVMELGATGRGEHMKIGTFLSRSVDSELSGNVIDLCPVGALTSKPYRYSARAWEMISRPAVSPHDCVGSNMTVQSLRRRVRRVLPRANEAINECWLSDRDRYSYEGVNARDRLSAPRVRDGQTWLTTDWQSALERTAEGLKDIVARHGGDRIGALVSPTATLEEFYLVQRLMRDLGSGNVDHRLRQLDFSDDETAPVAPGMDLPIADLERSRAILLVGSNVRKEQPIIGLRVRKAWLAGARVMALNGVDYDFHFRLRDRRVASPGRWPAELGALCAAVAAGSGGSPPVAGAAIDDFHRAVAQALVEAGGDAVIILGDGARMHPRAAELRALAAWLADASGARVALLPEANSVAAWLAGCVPHRIEGGRVAQVRGLDARTMLEQPLRGYLLFGIDPGLDSLLGSAARRALGQAEFVAAVSAFENEAADYADVLLPLAPFTESEGSMVNLNGTVQAFVAAVPPAGEARPGWKVLRVLGNFLGLPGYQYVGVEDVRHEIHAGDSVAVAGRPAAPRPLDAAPGTVPVGAFERILDVPPYAVDPIVRRAPALGHTADNPPPAARMHPLTIRDAGLVPGAMVAVRAGDGAARLPLVADERIAQGCVLVPSGYEQTTALGAAAAVTVEGAGR